MYEYKFVSVPFSTGFMVKKGISFEKCKEIIIEEAKNGWKLKQVVTPVNEKIGAGGRYCYEVIFEKEIK